jgi:Rrf2 family protein
VKSDYAARAVLGLAQAYPSAKPVRVESLAEGQGIPPKYLTRILIELKSGRIVKSVRGAEGGYLLARPPAEITLGDVLRAVHGQVFDSSALSDPACAAELKSAWERLQRAVNTAADGIHFQALLDMGTDKGRMYYI